MLSFCWTCHFFKYCDILKLWQVLAKTWFTTSKRGHVSTIRINCMQVISRVAKRLRSLEIRRKFGRDVAEQSPVNR